MEKSEDRKKIRGSPQQGIETVSQVNRDEKNAFLIFSYIEIIEDMYDRAVTSVRIVRWEIPEFPIGVGLQ